MQFLSTGVSWLPHRKCGHALYYLYIGILFWTWSGKWGSSKYLLVNYRGGAGRFGFIGVDEFKGEFFIVLVIFKPSSWLGWRFDKKWGKSGRKLHGEDEENLRRELQCMQRSVFVGEARENFTVFKYIGIADNICYTSHVGHVLCTFMNSNGETKSIPLSSSSNTSTMRPHKIIGYTWRAHPLGILAIILYSFLQKKALDTLVDATRDVCARKLLMIERGFVYYACVNL